MSCPHCGAEVPAGGHSPSCSAETFADAASAATQPIPGAPVPGPPPRGLSANAFRIAPGQRFGDRFTLVEEIGAGGMGQVYKAIDVTLGKTVALKLVRGRSGPQEQTLERFRRELTLAREVTHPNVCRVYDLGDIDGTLFISMEYVEGQSLDDLIQSVGTLSAKQTIAIARQICAGLDAIHFRKIVHRDLKPANIMVDRAGHPILMDFGLAYAHDGDRLTGEGAILGTLGYLSPEQAHGHATDARTDIYALGLILFEMLTGRRAPGDGGTAPLSLRDSGVQCPPPSRFSPDVPAELDAIVLRCLERDAARRYASSLELEAALARLAATLSSGVSAGRVRISAPRGRLATIAAVMVVVIALVSAARWWRPDRVSAGPEHPVIAVLPLVTVGGPPDDHLGIGMADTLIAHLAGIPTLTVVSRTAADGDARQVRRLAHELGADYVVRGSVVRVDRRMDVSATLVRPDDSVAWGGHYEGSVDDLFSLQRRLAEGVTAALAVRLTPADRARLARAPTSDTEAFAMYARARALLERPDVAGNVSRAIETLQQVIQRDPKFSLAHAALGEALWARYQETRDEAVVAKAQDGITEALRLDPEQPLTRIALALVYRGTNRGAQAAEELQRVLDQQPSNDDAHRLLGEILLDQGRTEAALTELRKAIAQRPDYWRNHASLGQAFFRTGRYADAAAAFKRITELQPDNSRGFQMRGTAFSLMGDDDQAVINYRRAIELAPDARAYSNLGTTYYRQGKFAEAAPAYEQAARLEPSSPIKFRNLGDVYARLGHRDRARQAYARAVELSESLLRVNPGDARTLGLLALSEAKLGRHDTAARHAEEASQMSPADGEVLYRKAVVAALAGHVDQSLAALGQALARGYSATDAARDDDFGSLRDKPTFRQLVIHPPPGAGKGGM